MSGKLVTKYQTDKRYRYLVSGQTEHQYPVIIYIPYVRQIPVPRRYPVCGESLNIDLAYPKFQVEKNNSFFYTTVIILTHFVVESMASLVVP